MTARETRAREGENGAAHTQKRGPHQNCRYKARTCGVCSALSPIKSRLLQLQGGGRESQAIAFQDALNEGRWQNLRYGLGKKRQRRRRRRGEDENLESYPMAGRMKKRGGNDPANKGKHTFDTPQAWTNKLCRWEAQDRGITHVTAYLRLPYAHRYSIRYLCSSRDIPSFPPLIFPPSLPSEIHVRSFPPAHTHVQPPHELQNRSRPPTNDRTAGPGHFCRIAANL